MWPYVRIEKKNDLSETYGEGQCLLIQLRL